MHARAACAPQKRAGPALDRNRGGFRTQIHILADQRGRPLCLRLTGVPVHAPDLPDRGPGLGRRRLPHMAGTTGHQGRPAGPAPASEPQPHDPERYKASNAMERGLGWLKGWQRVATRYALYAHRCLGFLYLADLAGTWIWMESKLHRT